MISSDDSLSYIEETEADRQRGILTHDGLCLDLVTAYAGDRELTGDEIKELADLKRRRGVRFFSDLFYLITHQFFAPEVAEVLWVEVIKHKHVLSKALQRNVGIVVATLDYFSNITEHMDAATLVGEVHIGEIIGQSLLDGLTGLFNHTYFYQQIELEVNRYLRYDTPLTLVLIDVDDFKLVNDTYGHPEGDKVLAAMGKILLELARDSDICCRYGGEEFAVILPLTSIHEANAIANRMRLELVQCLPDGRNVTVSIGVAVCGRNTKSFQYLVGAADAALYQVKKSGKNNVVVDQNEK